MSDFASPIIVLSLDRLNPFKDMFYPDTQLLSEGEVDKIRRIKLVILEGIKKSVGKGLPKEKILVIFDEYSSSVALQESIREEIFTGITIDNTDGDFQERIKNLAPHALKTHLSLKETISEAKSQRIGSITNFSKENGCKLFVEITDYNHEHLTAINEDRDIHVDSWIISYDSFVSNISELSNIKTSFILRIPDNQPLSPTLIEPLRGCTNLLGLDAGNSIYLSHTEQFFKGRIDGYRAAEDIAESLVTFYTNLNNLFANHS